MMNTSPDEREHFALSCIFTNVTVATLNWTDSLRYGFAMTKRKKVTWLSHRINPRKPNLKKKFSFPKARPRMILHEWSQRPLTSSGCRSPSDFGWG